jgi:hypothetical protein
MQVRQGAQLLGQHTPSTKQLIFVFLLTLKQPGKSTTTT